jgi:hypothetical protein
VFISFAKFEADIGDQTRSRAVFERASRQCAANARP